MARLRSSKKQLRGLSVRVKTAKGRKLSSTRWLQRQLNDPYVRSSKLFGYRSRSAWKLSQIDDHFKIFRLGCRVLDLGAAPGGWTQVSIERTGKKFPVIAVDIIPIEPINGAQCLKLDLKGEKTKDIIQDSCDGGVDVVLSDMAAATTGHRQTDHLRTLALSEIAVDVALGVLVEGGDLVIKVFHGGTEATLLSILKRSFQKVKHYKPPASRKESPETYLVAKGYLR